MLLKRREILITKKYKQYDSIDQEEFKIVFGSDLSKIFDIKDDRYMFKYYCGTFHNGNYEIIIEPVYKIDITFMLKIIDKEQAKEINQIECNSIILYKTEELFEEYARAVFEKFLFDLDGYTCKKEKGKNPIMEDDSWYIQKNKSELIIPDIVVRHKNQCVVFDAKYKNGRKKHNIREDRLQLLAYALMYNCKTVGHIFPLPKDDQSDEPIIEVTRIKNEGDSGSYIQIFIPTNESIKKLGDLVNTTFGK